MELNDYFESTKGVGVLATADSEGHVDAALYARPHVEDEETVAFIMADRLTHHNLESNPHAAYLFREQGGPPAGKRLFLTKVREETDPEKIAALRRRTPPACEEGSEGAKRFLVHFHIDKVLPLIGG